ncbi:MAG TPA: NAD-dependent epimerase/dehydratase family protein [Longimicrobiales bacterium]|nr:NAD-dependent epimerase/dehydratase family protein [Longimicrobiales bacterium]
MTNRRRFIQLSAAAGGALALEGLPGTVHAAAAPRYRGLPDVPAARRALRILILGGTGLTGPHQVRYAVARGHQVTVFNRGRRNDILPEEVIELQGDRNLHEVAALRGKDWDVVIDNPVMLPFWVKDAAEVLRGHTNQYVFISTISVYDPAGLERITEDSALHEYRDGDPLAVTPDAFRQNMGELYGPMKVASEREALKWFGDRTTIIRPGLIVGPGDGSFRFTYWPWRLEQGGDIVAPGDGHDPVQLIDTRDLAEWTIRMVEDGNTGTYNGTGPAGRLTMAEMLGAARGALPGNTATNLVWIPWEFLEQHEVRPWAEMTTWIPASDPDSVIAKTDNTRAIEKGLTFRPLAETSLDALKWVKELAPDAQARVTKAAGLPSEKEGKVLAAWKARTD